MEAIRTTTRDERPVRMGELGLAGLGSMAAGCCIIDQPAVVSFPAKE